MKKDQKTVRRIIISVIITFAFVTFMKVVTAVHQSPEEKAQAEYQRVIQEYYESMGDCRRGGRRCGGGSL